MDTGPKRLSVICTVCEESTFLFDGAFSASAKICLMKRQKQDEKKNKSKQHAKGQENKNPYPHHLSEYASEEKGSECKRS